MTKHLKAFVKSISKDGVITGAIASSENPDRDGDVLVAAGWMLDAYRKNPVLLWSHNPFIPPIGKVTKIEIQGSQLVFDAEIAKDKTDLAGEIFGLMEAGVLKTFSVGYIPKMQDEQGRTTQMELLEISVVSIPANPDAMVDPAKMQAFEHVMQKSTGFKTIPPPIVEEKVGRMLSEKNKSLITTAVDAMQQAGSALSSLLKDADNGDKGGPLPAPAKVPLQPAPSGAKKEVLNALRLADKAIGHALHTVKSTHSIRKEVK